MHYECCRKDAHLQKSASVDVINEDADAANPLPNGYIVQVSGGCDRKGSVTRWDGFAAECILVCRRSITIDPVCVCVYVCVYLPFEDAQTIHPLPMAEPEPLTPCWPAGMHTWPDCNTYVFVYESDALYKRVVNSHRAQTVSGFLCERQSVPCTNRSNLIRSNALPCCS